MADSRSLVEKQREFFLSGKTRGVDFRIAQLRKLKQSVVDLEAEILNALQKDLHKSEFEAYTSEIGYIKDEIGHTLSHLKSWAKPKRIRTPLALLPSQSRIHPEPKGVVLIIGPWNYPFQLILAPLIGAISAGNCIVIKTSELAPAMASLVTRLIEATFSPEYCAVVNGGVPETTELLRQRFDHVFFTGSVPVGRIVMKAAAEHLTPVTLELGGKSPCIVDEDIDLEVTARRIVWGKYFNAGQSCIAPDYLLVHNSVRKQLLRQMKLQVSAFFGDDPQQSPDYGRIVNRKHFDRLVALMPDREPVFGGENAGDDLYIAPTLYDDVSLNDKLMEDEIFGPLLPVIGYDRLDEALDIAQERPYPLACYVFTKNTAIERRVMDGMQFGGGCVNNALVHFTNPNLPFGGIGTSGIGSYHGKGSFDVFSHQKSIVKTPFEFDIKLKYPPYKEKLKTIKTLLRY